MRLGEAIRNFRVAGETQGKLLGKVNRTTANSFNDMGIAYHESGNLDEAEKWYRYRLDVLYDQGQLDEAIDLYFRVFAIREESLDVRHPDRISASRNLMILLCKQGQVDGAKTCLRRVGKSIVEEIGP